MPVLAMCVSCHLFAVLSCAPTYTKSSISTPCKCFSASHSCQAGRALLFSASDAQTGKYTTRHGVVSGTLCLLPFDLAVAIGSRSESFLFLFFLNAVIVDWFFSLYVFSLSSRPHGSVTRRARPGDGTIGTTATYLQHTSMESVPAS